MSRGVNKAIIIGNLGDNPEMRVMPNGNQVATISVATSESWTDKQTNQKQERTEWHRIVAFNRLAEIMGQYLKKGSKVYVEGSIRTRKWQDQQGVDRYTTEIVANNMQMLDSANNSGAQNQNYAPQNNYQQSQAPQNQPQGGIDFDDDVPFMKLDSRVY